MIQERARRHNARDPQRLPPRLVNSAENGLRRPLKRGLPTATKLACVSTRRSRRSGESFIQN